VNPFALLIGQFQAIALLTQAVQRDRVAPAYLFAGSNGIGRSLAVRCFIQLLFSQTVPASALPVLAKRLHQGNHPDVLWVSPTYQHQGKLLTVAEAEAEGITRRSAPTVRLEQIRQVTQFLSRPPLEANRAVVVLDNAELMAEPAANALLKTLEEPGHATIILLAPSTEAILPTLVSRCQRIPFFRLNPADMAQVLTQTGHTEVLQYPELLTMAQGSPGAAIAALRFYQSIPAELLQSTIHPPSSPRTALDLARQIAKILDIEQQLWLISYLQHTCWQNYWQHHTQPAPPQLSTPVAPPIQWLQQLETARKHLAAYAQPRLVWEVTLLTSCRT
jgi:DNA polymerase-3 subunit delta'